MPRGAASAYLVAYDQRACSCPWTSDDPGTPHIGRHLSFPIGYFLVLFVGFLLWIAYGVVVANLAQIIPNAVAAVVIVLTIIVALHYRQPPRSD